MRDSLVARAIERFNIADGAWGLLILVFGALVILGAMRSNKK